MKKVLFLLVLAVAFAFTITACGPAQECDPSSKARSLQKYDGAWRWFKCNQYGYWELQN